MTSTDLAIMDAEPVNGNGDSSIVILPPREEEFSGYKGAGTLIVTKDEQDKLAVQLHDDAHDILPTGEVYVSQVHYRRLLNNTFGPGQWALLPRGAFVKEAKGEGKEAKQFVYREYALVVRGHFVAEAIGEQEYFEKSMTYATACEAVKSNALTRCCKDLGVASECWDKRFCEDFKGRMCVQVWRDKGQKPEWRRKDATPFYNETGIVAKKGNASVGPSQGKEADKLSGSVSGSPTSDVATAGATPAGPITPEVVATPSQVERIWAIAGKRWPKRTDVEKNMRAILKDVAGVESSRSIPVSKYEAVVRAITGEAAPEEKEDF